jgi:hypothetical protein
MVQKPQPCPGEAGVGLRIATATKNFLTCVLLDVVLKLELTQIMKRQARVEHKIEMT